MELLTYDLVEEILERVDAESLVKMKVVSKRWKDTIENPDFQARQLMHRKHSNPDILFVSTKEYTYLDSTVEAMSLLVIGSSQPVKICTPWENINYRVCKSNCDGLICLYQDYVDPTTNKNIVCNPTIKWNRLFPLSNYQLIYDLMKFYKPGFGKDKISGTYKVVYLYNAIEERGYVHDKNSVTVCEVFDFTTDAWRYLVNSSPHQLIPFQEPLYFDGSLYWFTEGETTLVLSFDLHSETFQVISETPFSRCDHRGEELIMCDLNDRLCVSEKVWPKQVIWSFDSDHKTWTEIYSIDLIQTSFWFEDHVWALTLIALLDKDKLLFCDSIYGVPLLTLDPKTNTYNLVYDVIYFSFAHPICYFQSLISF